MNCESCIRISCTPFFAVLFLVLAKCLYIPFAPDIAGEGKANQIACILSFAMALRYSFNDGAEVERLENAVEKGLADSARTPDLLGPEGGSPISTKAMGDAILAALDASL